MAAFLFRTPKNSTVLEEVSGKLQTHCNASLKAHHFVSSMFHRSSTLQNALVDNPCLVLRLFLLRNQAFGLPPFQKIFWNCTKTTHIKRFLSKRTNQWQRIEHNDQH